MALSDCPKCWDTPCTCGYLYRHWDDDRIRLLIRTLDDVLQRRAEIATTSESRHQAVLVVVKAAEWPLSLNEIIKRLDSKIMRCSQQTIRDHLANLRQEGKVVITKAWGMTFYEARRLEET